MEAKPQLETLESRDAPAVIDFSYQQMPKGEPEALKRQLRDIQASSRIRYQAVSTRITVPLPPTMRAPGGAIVSKIPPTGHANLHPHPEMEVALMIFDPAIALAMSAIQVKKLDDFFANMERKGAKDPHTGRFVGFLKHPPNHEEHEPLVKLVPEPDSVPLALNSDEVSPDNLENDDGSNRHHPPEDRQGWKHQEDCPQEVPGL